MDKQLLIEKTRKVDSRQSLLDLLNEIKADMLGREAYPFTMRNMMLLCNPNLERNRYRHFTIPKKSGGLRDIYAPNGNLKWMQICLNEIFQAIYTPSRHAMGFVNGRSIVDNARMHTNQNYVFNIDLADFFPSIDQARVWKRLQLPPFNFNKEVANIIAGLCSIKSYRPTSEDTFSEHYNLPQGAPTSPLLTNAVCDKLDRRLAGLAHRFNLHYSRYADDITFSSMHNVYSEGSAFRKELERIINDQHFKINPKKTRLNHRSRRQEVTGLTVSEKVNVTRKYVKDIRAILHIWERYGINAALSAFYPRYKAEKSYLLREDPDIESVVTGKLCYLKMVKGCNDPQYMKLSEQFVRLKSGKKAVLKERSWEYLQSESIVDFEKRIGVTVQYAKSNKGKPYAFFELDGQRIFVSVSQNISLEQLPKDVQISLCRQTDFKIMFGNRYTLPFSQRVSTDIVTVGRIITDCPLPNDLGQRFFYLIHRPLKSDSQRKVIIKDQEAESFKKTVIDIAQQFLPELELRDAFGIIESSLGQPEDTLTQLIQSNFDLSILP